ADPVAETYNIDMTYWLPSGGDASAIAAAITAAVNEYAAWQGSKLGRNINPSKLASLVMQAGAARVEIREPEFTELRDGT
ncbi:MAG: baseplate J/gp47 family protein, partial [Oscillospiraceae bacterium]|nr:baseplate J/gp47 family protein [Oscillospiraceae bacterium]